MLIIKELTEEQINSLRVMADFNCGFIECVDCPLGLLNHCGSVLARKYIETIELESED